jgi:hypothetical protein
MPVTNWGADFSSAPDPMASELKTPDPDRAKEKNSPPLGCSARVEGGTVARAARCKGRREVLSLAAGWLYPGGHEQHGDGRIWRCGRPPVANWIVLLFADDRDPAKPWEPRRGYQLVTGGCAGWFGW